jgi:hypothetical protein
MIDSLPANVPEILVWLLIIGIAWIVLRFFLRLARKIFAFGCAAIIIIGLILLVLQYLPRI